MYTDTNKRGRKKLLLMTLAVAGLFFIDMLSGGIVRAPLRGIGAFLYQKVDYVWVATFGSGVFSNKAQLQSENNALRTKIASLQEQLAETAVSGAQIQSLRMFAHMASTTKGITAPIISSFTVSAYGTFLIGAGKAEGVQSGALVLSDGGFVVGTVLDVQQSSSLVSEIFRAGESIDVHAGSIPITLAGRGGGNAIGMAPRGSLIATGTAVTAQSALGKPVGLVEHVEGDMSSASTAVYVRTPVNFTELQFVYVENR